MKNIMIFLSTMMLLISSSAFAHTDQHLGEGTLHSAYHIIFWFVVFAVIYKAIGWFGSKNNSNK